MNLRVMMSKSAGKKLMKVPKQIQKKLLYWIDSEARISLDETRKIPGFHDEPLKNKETISIRLNKKWRAEYIISKDQFGNLIIIVEIHAHDYS